MDKDPAEAVRAASEGKVCYAVADGIAFITLKDPRRRNALSRALRAGVVEALHQLDADSSARVGVLTGEGPVFCAGADLKEMAEDEVRVPPRDYVPMVGRNVFIDKVLVAAVNGPALGGGFLLAQCADLVVASESATFGMPEASVGRGAPWSVPLAQKVPERIWMELALTGESISAKRAYEVGLINAVVARVDLMDEATRLAQRIARNAPLTVRATRRMIHLAAEMGRWAAWEVADEVFRQVYLSSDAQEGPRAFKEHRPPRWSGR